MKPALDIYIEQLLAYDALIHGGTLTYSSFNVHLYCLSLFVCLFFWELKASIAAYIAALLPSIEFLGSF